MRLALLELMSGSEKHKVCKDYDLAEYKNFLKQLAGEFLAEEFSKSFIESRTVFKFWGINLQEVQIKNPNEEQLKYLVVKAIDYAFSVLEKKLRKESILVI